MSTINVGGLGFNKYSTLNEAVSVAHSGDTISINQTITVNKMISVQKSIVINANNNIININDDTLGIMLYSNLTIENANIILGNSSNFIRKIDDNFSSLKMSRVEISHSDMNPQTYYPGMVLIGKDNKSLIPIDLEINNCGVDYIFANINSLLVDGKSNLGNSSASFSNISANNILIKNSQINNSKIFENNINAVIEMKDVSTTGNLVTVGNLNLDGFSVDPLSLDDEPYLDNINDNEKLIAWSAVNKSFKQLNSVYALQTYSNNNLSLVKINRAHFSTQSLLDQNKAYGVNSWFSFTGCKTTIYNSKIVKTLNFINVQKYGTLNFVDSEDSGQWEKIDVESQSNDQASDGFSSNSVNDRTKKNDDLNNNQNSDGYVASINNRKYMTLEDAITNSSNDDTIILNKNTNLSTINIDHNLTIIGNSGKEEITTVNMGIVQNSGQLNLSNLKFLVDKNSHAVVNNNKNASTLLVIDNVYIRHNYFEANSFLSSICYLDPDNIDLPINGSIKISNSNIDYIRATCSNVEISNSQIGLSYTAFSQLVSKNMRLVDSDVNNSSIVNVNGDKSFELRNITTETPLMFFGDFNIEGLKIAPIEYNLSSRSQLIEIKRPFDILYNNMLQLPVDNGNAHFAISAASNKQNGKNNLTIKKFEVEDLGKLSDQIDISNIIAWFDFFNIDVNFVDCNIPNTISGKQNVNKNSDIKFENSQDESNWTNIGSGTQIKVKNKIDKSEQVDNALGYIQNLIGLDPVKKEINSIIDLAKANKARSGSDKSDININLVFEGNPGTGKTVVARLFAQALYQNGVLDTAKFSETSASEMLDMNGPMAAKKVHSIVQSASGGILFIDEAYSLDPNDDNTGIVKFAVNQLIKDIGDIQGSDKQLIVIMAGYTDRMEQLFERANPGLASRFPKSNRIEFPDYNTKELMGILQLDLEKEDLKCENSALNIIQKVVSRLYDADLTNGNGRFVKEDIVERLKKFQATRLARIGIPNTTQEQRLTINNMDAQAAMAELLKTNDMNIDENGDNDGDALEEINSLIGLKSVKNSIKELINTSRIDRIRAEKSGSSSIAMSMNMIFEGNPGTGKTVVARLIAKALFQHGVLKTSKFKETSKKDFVADYVGQTAKKTHKVIMDSLNGVLFIDEAYALAPNNAPGHDFNKEAVDQLVADMENYRDKLVIIMAGYTKDMEQFLNTANPGLRSRIPNTIIFPDYNAKELMEIYKLQLKQANLKSTDDSDEIIYDAIVKLKNNNLVSGNGRYIRNYVVANVKNELSNRLSQLSQGELEILSEDELNTITKEDAINATNKLIPANLRSSSKNDNNKSQLNSINSKMIQEYRNLLSHQMSKEELDKISDEEIAEKIKEEISKDVDKMFPMDDLDPNNPLNNDNDFWQGLLKGDTSVLGKLQDNKSNGSNQSEQTLENDNSSSEGHKDNPLQNIKDIVGMDDAKNPILKIINLSNLNQIRKSNGLPTPPLIANFLFKGDFPSQKIELAKLFEKALYKTGGLKEDKFNIIDGAKISHLELESFVNGVLLINNISQMPTKLIDQLTNNLSNLIVILSVSPNDEQFLQDNADLAKYFPNVSTFKGYSKDELAQVFIDYLSKQGLNCSPEATNAIKDKFNQDNFKMNGTEEEMKDLTDKLLTAQSLRLMSMTSNLNGGVLTDDQRKEMTTFTVSDVNEAL